MALPDRILRLLLCPACHGGVFVLLDAYRCVRCARQYSVKGDCVLFVESAGEEEAPRPDEIIFRLKSWVKKSPRFFTFLNRTLGTYVGKSARESIAGLPFGSAIVSIGSGAEIIRADVINVDIEAYPGVSVAADIHALPFRDNSIDAVIAESVLEHVKDPARAVKEIHRVLKSGGLLYVVTPFIIGYHSSPGDYYRWTTSGLRELLKDFKERELGISVGPTNALTYILREWLATLLSFNIGALQQIFTVFFMALFAPINLLDHWLARYRSSVNIAHLYYFIGVK